MTRTCARRLFGVAVACQAAACFAASVASYEDCVADATKGGANPPAASEIAGECRRKFPGDEHVLPKEVLEKLAGDRGRIAQRGMTKEFVFSTTLRNDNPDWIVTGLTIAIVPQAPGDAALGSRDYDVSVTLLPLTTKRIQVDIEPIGQAAFSWQLKAAKGRQSD